MRRKKTRNDIEAGLIAIVRTSPRIDRYTQLYPSLPSRIQQMLTSNDPKLRDKVKVLGGALLKQEARDGTAFARRFSLTPAQMRIALHIADNGTVAEYAAKTGISEQTVRTHLKAIFAKTGVSRQAELSRLVLKG